MSVDVGKSYRIQENMEEKEFRRTSSLTKLSVKSVIGYLILVSIKQVFNPA